MVAVGDLIADCYFADGGQHTPKSPLKRGLKGTGELVGNTPAIPSQEGTFLQQQSTWGYSLCFRAGYWV